MRLHSAAALLTLLLIGSCGTGSRPRPAPQAAAAFSAMRPAQPLSLDQRARVLAELERSVAPPEVAAADWQQLTGGLRALLQDPTARQAAALPAPSRNQVLDLAVVDSGGGALSLSWSYRNTGDYSRDGEVNISDLTPLGIHLGKTSTAPDWASAQVADGDANGAVTISDLTPIGANLLSQALGYNIYSAASADGPWTLVGTLALADAPGGSFSFALGPAPAPWYTVMPYDALGKDWYGSGGYFVPGTVTPVADGALGPAGGTLDGAAGSPLEGVSVSVPPGALRGTTQVSIGYDSGSVVPADGVWDGLVLELDTTHPGEFEEPLEITLPYSGAGTYLPVPYYIDGNGRLDSCDLVAIDAVNGTYTFATWHASKFTTIKALIAGPARAAYASDFSATDGFQIENTGSTLSTGGNCMGMAAFANWYYRTYGPLLPELHGRFMQDLPGGKKGQHVVAARAHLSLSRRWAEYYPKLNTQDLLFDHEVFNLIASMMINKGGPVLLYIENNQRKWYHCVVAIAYDNDSLEIYDPNFPGQLNSISFDGAQLGPYVGGGLSFDEFSYLGVGSVAVAEPFDNILDAAEAGFAGFDATLEVSPANGSLAATTAVTIEATVHSGEILVEELGVLVLHETKQPQFVRAAPVDKPAGRYSIPLTLGPGENWLMFVPSGFNDDNQRVMVDHSLETTQWLISCNPPQALYPVDVTFEVLTWPADITPNLQFYIYEPDGDVITNFMGAQSSSYVLDSTADVQYGEEYKARFLRYGNPGPATTYRLTVGLNTWDFPLRPLDPTAWETFRQYEGAIAEPKPAGPIDPHGTGPWWSEYYTFTPHLPGG